MRSASPSALLSTLIGWLGEETRARARARWRRCLRRWRFHSRLAPAPPPRCSLASVLRPASRPRPAARHQRCSGKVYVASTLLSPALQKRAAARALQTARRAHRHSQRRQAVSPPARLQSCRCFNSGHRVCVFKLAHWCFLVFSCLACAFALSTCANAAITPRTNCRTCCGDSPARDGSMTTSTPSATFT